MKRFPKSGKSVPMYETTVPNRENTIERASELMQELWTRGALCRRIKDAADVLTAKPYEWSFNRVFYVFKGKAKRIDSHEMEHLLSLKRAREAKDTNDGINELRARLSRLEASLAVADEEYHRPTIDGLRQSLRELGGMADSGKGRK